MKFSRIGEHTIKCVISEEEIYDLGFTMEEIMSNGERTQEFMNQIFDMAEQNFETKFELGIKTVRADFMSDHTLSLTFSEHPGSDEMLEHLKDIVNGLMNSIPPQKWNEVSEVHQNAEKDEVSVQVTIMFEELDVLIRYAKAVSVSTLPPGMLYKDENRYMLILNLTDLSEEELAKMSNLTDEYASDLFVGVERKAYIEEHGTCILQEKALERLREL